MIKNNKNNGNYSILPAGSPNDSAAGPGKTYQCAVVSCGHKVVPTKDYTIQTTCLKF